MIFVGFDGEFSGPFAPNKHYLVALGLVAVDENGKELCKLRVSMQPPTAQHGFDDRTRRTFWDRPEMQAMLRTFQREAVPPETGMAVVRAWLDALVEKYGAGQIRMVCDCPADATWLDYYLVTFTVSKPLIEYTGEYTGWPYVADDAYRGIVGSLDSWGVSETARRLLGITGVPPATHDPADDAREIAMTYARVMKARCAKPPAAGVVYES